MCFFHDFINFLVLSTCFDASGAGVGLGGVLFVVRFLYFSEVGSTEPPQAWLVVHCMVHTRILTI